MKPRILVASEYHGLSSGYGKYNKYLLEALSQSGKYEVAEFSSYGEATDENKKLPWKFYPNMPSNTAEYKVYKSNGRNEYGLWRFDRVVLDFLPTHVLVFRDFWMDSHVFYSPLREYYNIICLAPVDSVPLLDYWLQYYIDADQVLNFTEWGKNCLDYYGGGLIKTAGDAPGCVDSDIFKPVANKNLHKQIFGLNPDDIVIGTVMRNQIRKLYPHVFDSFKIAQSKTAKKLKLLIHTAYPDRGWDIATLIQEYGISNDILMSYICANCNRNYVRNFRDIRSHCDACHQYSCKTPSVEQGMSEDKLANVYNLMDIYLQLSTCEGQGFPMVEAAACGLPTIGMDFSATGEVLRKVGGYVVDPGIIYKDVEMCAYRAMPNVETVAEQLVKLAEQPIDYRNKKSIKYREIAISNYGNWSRTTNRWLEAIDKSEMKNRRGQWNAPPKIQPVTDINIDSDLSHNDFIKRIIIEVLNKPELLFSKQQYDWLEGLTISNIAISPGRYQKFSRAALLSKAKEMIEDTNRYEDLRINREHLEQPDYIKFAN